MKADVHWHITGQQSVRPILGPFESTFERQVHRLRVHTHKRTDETGRSPELSFRTAADNSGSWQVSPPIFLHSTVEYIQVILPKYQQKLGCG